MTQYMNTQTRNTHTQENTTVRKFKNLAMSAIICMLMLAMIQLTITQIVNAQDCGLETESNLRDKVLMTYQAYPKIDSLTIKTSNCRTTMTIKKAENGADIEFEAPPGPYRTAMSKKIEKCRKNQITDAYRDLRSHLTISEMRKQTDEERFRTKQDLTLISSAAITKKINFVCSEKDAKSMRTVILQETLDIMFGEELKKRIPEKYAIPFTLEKRFKEINEEQDSKSRAREIYIITLSVLGIASILIPWDNLVINNQKALIPARLARKWNQSSKILAMTAVATTTNAKTAASLQKASKNLTTGYFSQSGQFMSGYNDQELAHQTVAATLPYDVVIYQDMKTDEETGLIQNRYTDETEIYCIKKNKSRWIKELSEIQKERLGLRQTSEDADLPEENEVTDACGSFRLTRLAIEIGRKMTIIIGVSMVISWLTEYDDDLTAFIKRMAGKLNCYDNQTMKSYC